MNDKKSDRSKERRKPSDRRVAQNPAYAGDDRRTGGRRNSSDDRRAES